MAHEFVEGKFVERYEPTREAYNKVVVVGKDELQLGDTAGQDEYTTLPHSFIISISGYVLLCLVTSLQSFQVVKTLHNERARGAGAEQGRPGPAEVSTGILTKLLEELNQVDNSSGRSPSCCLM